MRKLVQFCWCGGRSGSLEGLFIVDEEGWETLQKMVREGPEIHFGEAFGKHSEVSIILKEGDVEILSVDQEFIDDFKTYVGDSFGHNPLDVYLGQERESDDE